MITANHKKIFGILFFIVLLLLLTEIIIEKLDPATADKAKITSVDAESLFLTTLFNFGFKKEWYFRKDDTYFVSLPNDLPAELVILELSSNRKEKDFNIKARELVKGQRSEMILFSGGEEVLKVNFVIDKEKRRHSSDVSFLLLNTDDLNAEESTELLDAQENYSIALYPSKKNRLIAESLIRSGKQYAVIINNSIDELEYRLDDKFSDKKLLITIQSIIAHFPDAEFYLIDEYESGLSPRVSGILKKELMVRNIKYNYLKEFVSISSIRDGSHLEEVIDSNTGKKEIFIIDAGDYLQLKDEMKYLRKRGFRIVPL